MEIFTLNRNFHKQDIIDGFLSAIWTERYYGNGEVELVVPATYEMINKLPIGILLSLTGSGKVMIVETMDIEDGKMKLTGLSLLPWLNNRFVRTSDKHIEKSWLIENKVPGEILWEIVKQMCTSQSEYLNGSKPMGIPVAQTQQFVIPGLHLADFDKSGPAISWTVEFEPVYNALQQLATTYEIGMEIVLEEVSETSFSLGFRSFKGLDRTSTQTVNEIVRFSPQTDSFTNIHEIQSIGLLKTQVFVFATETAVEDLATSPGFASLSGPQYTGFDLRALQFFEDNITTKDEITTSAQLLEVLNSQAANELDNNRYLKAVDGEIVPMNPFQFGVHYRLGDIIEVQGNSEVIQPARVTEYIRSQDDSGERAYPTVAPITL